MSGSPRRCKEYRGFSIQFRPSRPAQRIILDPEAYRRVRWRQDQYHRIWRKCGKCCALFASLLQYISPFQARRSSIWDTCDRSPRNKPGGEERTIQPAALLLWDRSKRNRSVRTAAQGPCGKACQSNRRPENGSFYAFR